MEYKIAICDDEAAQREYLSGIVYEWADRRRDKAEVRQYSDAKAFLFDYDEEKDFDILLLDIEMGEMDGVSLAKKLREENESVQIVFITGYPDYISQGYEVAAVNFLLKPVNGGKLIEVLDRAASACRKMCPSLIVATDRETVRVPYDDIYYAVSDGHYMMIHARKGEYRVRMTVTELLDRLGEGFYRCSRYYIANLRYVNRITRNEVFLDSSRIALSLGRGKYDEINHKLVEYLRKM